ncbi:MAG: hypothetical protein JNN30_10170 [Rhodanobacteraceae bacterium]|nr:hypothetical protein [Rhodanobacteraceae bacterium]
MSLLRIGALILALSATLRSPAPAAKEISGILSARPATSVATPVSAGRHHLKAGTTLYVPETIPADAAAPFLLLLHGGGGTGENMIRKFKRQADRHGIILLAPDAAGPTWDVALSMTGNPWTQPSFGRDVLRIDAVLKDAFARVNVDPQRVAVAGFSDGASNALSIGVHNAALFHDTLAFSAGGMVPHRGGPPGRVLFIHGAKDPVLPITTMRDSLAPTLRAAGFAVTFVTFDGGHELPDRVVEQAIAWWLGL